MTYIRLPGNEINFIEMGCISSISYSLGTPTILLQIFSHPAIVSWDPNGQTSIVSCRSSGLADRCPLPPVGNLLLDNCYAIVFVLYFTTVAECARHATRFPASSCSVGTSENSTLPHSRGLFSCMVVRKWNAPFSWMKIGRSTRAWNPSSQIVL